MVQELGAKLSLNDVTVCVQESGVHFELTTADRFSMTQEETSIVTSWFREHSGPMADPWSDRLKDGQHRLWSVWQDAPEARLPIYSEHLSSEDSVGMFGDDLGLLLQRISRAALGTIPGDAGVRERSVAYFDQLARSAAMAPEMNDFDRKRLMELL